MSSPEGPDDNGLPPEIQPYERTYTSQVWRMIRAGATPEQAEEMSRQMNRGWFYQFNHDGEPIGPEERREAREDFKQRARELRQQNLARGREDVDTSFDWDLWREDYEEYKSSVA